MRERRNTPTGLMGLSIKWRLLSKCLLERRDNTLAASIFTTAVIADVGRQGYPRSVLLHIGDAEGFFTTGV